VSLFPQLIVERRSYCSDEILASTFDMLPTVNVVIDRVRSSHAKVIRYTNIDDASVGQKKVIACRNSGQNATKDNVTAS